MAKNLEDMVLVSVDDHLIEPPDMFEHHIAPEFKHRAPHIAKGSDGAHHWVVEGKKAPGLGLNAVAGRPREEFGFEPVSYDQVRKGCFDVDARIDDMNANGVLGSVCFGSFPGFAGARFQNLDDKALGLATIQAYNNWHVHDWCGKHPGRFIPIGLLPLWDPQLAVQEVERIVKLGVHAVAFPENPSLPIIRWFCVRTLGPLATRLTHLMSRPLTHGSPLCRFQLHPLQLIGYSLLFGKSIRP